MKARNALLVTSVVIALSGCAQKTEIEKCPTLGFRLEDPLFSTQYKISAIDAYYSCVSAHSDHDDSWGLFGSAFGKSSISLDGVKYQWDLQRQVVQKEKTPETAQRDWAAWKAKPSATTAKESEPSHSSFAGEPSYTPRAATSSIQPVESVPMAVTSQPAQPHIPNCIVKDGKLVCD